MGVRITWFESNLGEDGHRVYRSETPMDPQNLPAPLADLGPDVMVYDDGTVLPDTTYYYRTAAYVGGVERVSEEKQVTTTELSVVPTVGEQVRFTMDDVSGTVLPDNSVNSFDGEIVNFAGNPSGVDGLALEFNGTNTHVKFAETEFQHLEEGFTLSAWVKIPVSAESGTFLARVTMTGSNQIQGAFLFRYGVQSGSEGPLADFRINVPGQSTSSDGLFFSKTLADDNWHHVAASYGPKYGHRLYLDGVLDAESDEYRGVVYFGNDYCYMGIDYRPLATGNKFVYPLRGSMDQARIYDRELDYQHIVRLANEFSGVL